MQKMPFYLPICGLLKISKNQNGKTIIPFVELSAKGLANE